MSFTVWFWDDRRAKFIIYANLVFTIFPQLPGTDQLSAVLITEWDVDWTSDWRVTLPSSTSQLITQHAFSPTTGRVARGAFFRTEWVRSIFYLWTEDIRRAQKGHSHMNWWTRHVVALIGVHNNKKALSRTHVCTFALSETVLFSVSEAWSCLFREPNLRFVVRPRKELK